MASCVTSTVWLVAVAKELAVAVKAEVWLLPTLTALRSVVSFRSEKAVFS